MKLKNHVLTQVPLFYLLFPFLGIKNSLIICIFHFIPSLDYFLMKFRIIRSKFHRKLFHNIFVAIIASSILFCSSKNIAIAILGFSNIIFHFVLDKFEIDIFFPLSYFISHKKICIKKQELQL